MNSPFHCQNTFESVPLQPTTEKFIFMNALITGPTYLLTNLIVLCLIIFDSDSRNYGYRRYLIFLQIISTLADVLLTMVVPVSVAREWILYYIGFLPHPLQMVHALIAYLFLIIEIASAYIACLLFVHQATIPASSIFAIKKVENLRLFVALKRYREQKMVNFLKKTGRFFPIVIAINVYTLFYLPALWFGLTGAIEEKTPDCLSWLKQKESFAVFRFSDSIWLIVFGGIITSFPLYLLVFFFFLHIIVELRKISLNSAASRIYQKKMVSTLAIQATVPNISVIIPLTTQIVVIMFQPRIISQDATAIIFSLTNSHAMLNSLTIILRSPSYLSTVTKPFRIVFRKCWRGAAVTSSSNITHVSSETKRQQQLSVAMISYAA